jgi:hypothetical protein
MVASWEPSAEASGLRLFFVVLGFSGPRAEDKGPEAKAFLLCALIQGHECPCFLQRAY